MAVAWKAFMVPVTRADQPWLRTEYAQGLDASRAAMLEVIAGKSAPDVGNVLSL